MCVFINNCVTIITKYIKCSVYITEKISLNQKPNPNYLPTKLRTGNPQLDPQLVCDICKEEKKVILVNCVVPSLYIINAKIIIDVVKLSSIKMFDFL